MPREIRVFTVVLCVALFTCEREPRKTGLDELARVPASRRHIELRLTGDFAWAPFVAASANGTPAIRHAAGIVIQDSSSPHAVAVAQLLTGNIRMAIDGLERATRTTPRDARLWSDLSAAHCLLARHVDNPAEYPRALSCADHALTLDPDLPEARFNRAIILEKLGLQSWAAVEWAKYLARDRDSDWAAEARSRFTGLRKQTPSFKERFPEALRAARNKNLDPLLQLVRDDPQTARFYGNGFILLPWLDGAVDVFDNARSLATALVAVSGDHFLSDYVASFDEGRANRDAFRHYVQGRGAYGRQRKQEDEQAGAAAAEAHFQAAAALSRGTPLEKLALYYAASAAFDQDRIDESDAMLKAVLERTDRNRYPGLVGDIELQLGRSAGYRGRWSDCLAHLGRARAIFATLREQQLVSFVDATIAEAYEHIGLFEEGWRLRVTACSVLSRGGAIGADRLNASIAGGVRAEIFRHEFGPALSLAALLVERLEYAGQPELLAEALNRRARVLQASGERRRAGDDIRRARQIAMTIPDEKTARRALNETNIIDALNLREREPAAAAALLSDVLSSYREAREAIWLPPLYLERGRAYRALGRDEDAIKDYDAAIAEIERQRLSLQIDDLRSSFFDTEPELISEAVDLLIRSQKHDDDAFAVIERARARTLIEQLGISPSQVATAAAIRRTLRADELLIVYQLMPDGVALLALDDGELTVRRVTIARASLQSQVETLRDLIASNSDVDSIHRESAVLWSTLIAPVSDLVANAAHLIIVPDRFLFEVPYAALYDRHYLIETHSITVMPGASMSLRRKRLMEFEPALVVGDPDGSLRGARFEASRVAAFYGRNILLTGADATIANFTDAANTAALIHYAGHARLNAAIEGVLPLNGADAQGELTAAGIAHFSLRRHPLVVLAACGTLRGNAAHVEGMPSLARAFLAAGAQTVVGTLWNIPDDDANAFFYGFHRHLRQERDASLALAAAQRECVHGGGKRSHPSFWAAVEALGN